MRSISRFVVLAAGLLTAAPVAAQATRPAVTPTRTAPAVPATYQIDPVHSELSFRVRHLVGRVAGTFTEWGGTLQGSVDDLRAGAVNVTVRTASIHTLNAQRDAHLRTPDFFAADSFPTITFRSTKVEQYGTRVRVHGDLTMRGRTRPVVLSGVYLGRMPRDPWGKERVAFQATTTVNRQDFGIAFNQMVEGASMIDDEVRIEIAIEAVKQ